MEFVKSFFDDIHNFVIEAKDLHKMEYDLYASLGNFDWDEMIKYRTAIANKLLTMDEKTRPVYANLIIRDIDLFNIASSIVDEEVVVEGIDHRETPNAQSYRWYPKNIAIEKGIEGVENEKIYYLYLHHKTQEYIDVNCVISDCNHFIELIWSVFNEFDIDLKEVAKNRNDLEEDYSRLGRYSRGKTSKSINDYYRGLSNLTTSAQQVLAIESMLSELGIDTMNASKTSIASFMQFITGRQINSLPQNTNMYKLIGKSPNTDNEIKAYNRNCDLVASHFDKIGLSDIANKIKNGRDKN